MAKVQPATFNEEWSNERIYSYLNHDPVKGDSKDFGILYQAYKHMRIQDFETLLSKFVADGYDVNGKNKAGKTLVEIISEHKDLGDDFIKALVKHS